MSGKPADIDLKSQIKQQLLASLEKIDRPGSFCTNGRLPPAIPGLEVSGLGTIPLPLEETQAVALKRLARQAPYGKGERTLVDTDVRRVWEIDADQVTLSNPEWSDIVKQVVAEVQSALGLEKRKLESHLYKLLLYEAGSFFLSHRDGEKLDRMVATLVIALPAAHEGGELIVRHEGKEEIIGFGGPESRFHAQFASFYADCEHEIRPVKSGFRLTLVYNLTLAKSKRRISAPTSGEHVQAIRTVMDLWRAGSGVAKPSQKKGDQVPTKLAVLLDHRYTQAGLCVDALKGTDRRKAEILFEACRTCGFDAHLALVSYWQYGTAEYAGSGEYERYRYGGWDDDDDDYEMGDLADWSLTAEHFSDSSGRQARFGRIPLEEDEIVSEAPIDDGEPDDEDFGGDTGNAGLTLERWYRRAALILWPAERRFDIWCQAGVKAATGGLEQMVRELKKAERGERDGLRRQCLDLASRIVDVWPSQEYALNPSFDAKADRDRLLPLLKRLDDAPLIARWLREVPGKDVCVNPGKALGDVCGKYGWTTFEGELRRLFADTDRETIARNTRLLAQLSLRNDRNADRRRVCGDLAEKMQEALERWDIEKTPEIFRSSIVKRSELLPPLVKSFIALEELDLLGRLVEHVLGHRKKYGFTQTQIPALLSLRKWLESSLEQACPPLRHWLTVIREELEGRAANPPEAPTDWRRGSKMSCDCEDCGHVRRFLDDPSKEILRFPVAKERRRHLHQVIDRNRLDLTHETERRGSPYTLVCTKTSASHERAVEAHRVDLDHLRQIRDLLEWHDGLSSP